MPYGNCNLAWHQAYVLETCTGLLTVDFLQPVYPRSINTLAYAPFCSARPATNGALATAVLPPSSGASWNDFAEAGAALRRLASAINAAARQVGFSSKMRPCSQSRAHSGSQPSSMAYQMPGSTKHSRDSTLRYIKEVQAVAVHALQPSAGSAAIMTIKL